MLDKDLQAQFDSLLPGKSGDHGATRRGVIKLALGVGYAATAMPIIAQTAIKTSAEGLKSGEISYLVNGFKVPAFYAAPAGKTNLPIVLVVHEIFGVHEYIADVCNRFAQAGYMAIAPDCFARQGDAAEYGEIAKLIANVVSKVPDAQVMADLDGAVDWASSNGGDLNKVAVTGFCWGGRITWLYASHGPVKAAVAWYGRLVGIKNDKTPFNPIDRAANMKAPVLGLYGGKDKGIPLDTLEAMKEALSRGGVSSKAAEFVIYPEAPHAFHADYRSSYREDAAKDGMTKCLSWFKKHGVI